MRDDPTDAPDPQSFDHLPERYDRFAELVGTELRAWLDTVLPDPPGDPFAAAGFLGLDAGCGTGVHTGLLADRCASVLAVDLSAPMIDYARRRRNRANVEYEVRDLRDLTPRGDGQYDIVLCAYTLHHLGDLVAVLRHLRSLVTPGGTLLLVDVVDDRGTVPRRWFRAEAWRTFRADLTGRRRPVREAVELLRLNLDPDWIDHQTNDRLIPPALWESIAREVFTGATITGLDRARALAWRAPVPLTGRTPPAGHSGAPTGARTGEGTEGQTGVSA